MEVYGADKRLSDMGTIHDFSDLLSNDYYSAGILQHTTDMDTYNVMDNDSWLDSFFENDIVLNDKMMSEAMQPPRIHQSEHSYSMANSESDPDPDSPLNLSMEKMDVISKEMDNEVFTPASNQACTSTPVPFIPNVIIKQEPVEAEETHSCITQVKQPTILLATQQVVPQVTIKPEHLLLSKVNIKMEMSDSCENIDQTDLDTLTLPPTPPSSSNSDSESCHSPTRSAPPSPQRSLSFIRHQPFRTYSQPLFTSPIPQSGILRLSDEEKRTLMSEGYPIPTKLPLTKQEEKNLKKIRRKIKNKISAQESRRKKKEYLETLEKKMELYNQENVDLKKKVDHLENNNRSLLSQLQKLQTLIGRVPRPSAASSTQTGTCLMVLVLCFAVFMGGWSPTSVCIGYSPLPTTITPSSASNMQMGPKPQKAVIDDYTTPNMRSRVLLSLKEEIDEHSGEPFGPYMPFSYQDMFNRFLQAIGGKSDSIDQSEESRAAASIVRASVLLEKADVAVTVEHTANKTQQVTQAVMHPDIAANVTTHFLGAHMNATA